LWDEVGYLESFTSHLIMLIGEYIHTLDPKKRLSLPSKFRKEIGKKVIITRGLDHCLFVYSVSEWKKFSEKLGELSMGQADTRAFNRFLLGGAIETDVDASGRILIPDFLKDFANLKSKVVLAGLHNRIEVWNEKAWKQYTSGVEQKADTLAEKLGDIGMI
jgi:MraZ protein